MKRYNVTVNGNLYQVEVDEVSGEFKERIVAAPVAAPAVQVAAPAAPVAAPAAAATPVAAPAPTPAAPKQSSAQGEKITAPMPGAIVKVNVTEGAQVKKGDVLVVLEAMKMENEIMSPADGTVLEIVTSKGSTVNTGDILAVIG